MSLSQKTTEAIWTTYSFGKESKYDDFVAMVAGLITMKGTRWKTCRCHTLVLCFIEGLTPKEKVFYALVCFSPGRFDAKLLSGLPCDCKIAAFTFDEVRAHISIIEMNNA